MEHTKQLTIEKVEVAQTGESSKGAWTRYRVKTTDGYYSAFNLNLTPGMVATFKVKEEPGTKINPATNQPYINKTIVSFVGAADSVKTPQKAARDADPGDAPATQKDIADILVQLHDLTQRVDLIEAARNPLNQ